MLRDPTRKWDRTPTAVKSPARGAGRERGRRGLPPHHDATGRYKLKATGARKEKPGTNMGAGSSKPTAEKMGEYDCRRKWKSAASFRPRQSDSRQPPSVKGTILCGRQILCSAHGPQRVELGTGPGSKGRCPSADGRSSPPADRSKDQGGGDCESLHLVHVNSPEKWQRPDWSRIGLRWLDCRCRSSQIQDGYVGEPVQIAFVMITGQNASSAVEDSEVPAQTETLPRIRAIATANITTLRM